MNSGSSQSIRKMLTLVIFLVTTLSVVAWVRGIRTKDVIQFGSGNDAVFDSLIFSHHGVMWIRAVTLDGSKLNWNPDWFEVDSSPKLHIDESAIISDVVSRWSWAGFDFCLSSDGSTFRHNHRNVPYWSIVVPLLLLTAYLHFGKPRPPKVEQKSAV